MKDTPSIQSKMLNRSLKGMVHGLFDKGLKLDRLRKDDFPEPGPLARRKCRIEPYGSEEISGTWLYPKKGNHKGTILYFHGGAYVSGPSLLHWRMIAHICRKEHYRILLINYPKAPESPYPAALETMESVYQDLLSQTKNENIIFMGDSAGGGLALALTMKLRDQGITLPVKQVLLSPWLNVALDHKDTEKQTSLDNMLALPGLNEAATHYSGEQDMKSPYISPLFGDLKNLPPTYLMVGTLELILPDCRDFRTKAEVTGMDLLYEEWNEMFHVWMLNTPYLPEAKEAVNRIINWLNSQ